MRRIMDAVEMPDRVAADLLLFTRQNKGTLPKKRREQEFAALTDAEVRQMEAIVTDAFEGFEEAAGDAA
jgi:hypothetical protein